MHPDVARPIMDRTAARRRFVTEHGWGNAEETVLAADASFRCYYRLTQHDAQAVLMDAPPPQEDTRPFSRIARVLHDLGYSAPTIHASDEAGGFLLLEDLGDNTFTNVLRSAPHLGETLYALATDLLVDLHKRWQAGNAAAQHTPIYDTALLLRELELYPDWTPDCPLPDKQQWLQEWQQRLLFLEKEPHTLVLRDFHVDNLMHLPDRPELRQCGLLDFQDAVLGHPAYDLVSLLWDARRDVSPALEKAMLARYRQQRGLEDAAWRNFLQAYTLLGLQRTYKIIGIFHRLHRRDGKPQYLQHLPRLSGYLTRGGEPGMNSTDAH